MATETKIRIRRNPYSGYEVWICERGELIRRSFDNSIDLATKLAGITLSDGTKLDNRMIELACDLLDVYEWGGEPEYPLGVSYRPVAEAAAYEIPYDEPDHTRFWDWLAATIRLGAITAPWVAIVILVRWAGGW